MNKVVVFLPMRKGSQRVKNKNIRDFAGIKGGLTYIKISQLLKVNSIDKIIISTDDQVVKEIAESFNSNKIIIDNRPSVLASSDTSTDDLINYVPSIASNAVILWTHVTSPFVDEIIYNDMINTYFSNLKKFDSLMSVTKVQTFLWNDNQAINYDRVKEKWPRTQTIKPLFEVNSAAFIADINIYKRLKDRIGEKVYLHELDSKIAFDIDWEEDFEIAEVLWRKYGNL